MGLVHHPNVVSDGLVCCWDAANRRSYPATGTTWIDVVGGQNGTMQNNTSFNSAKGGALEFDGTNDYVSVPDSDYLDSITSAITVSVWVYWSSDANDISTIISKASAAGWSSPYSSWNMRLRHGTGSWGTDTVEFWAAGSYTTGGNFFSSSSIPRDTWTHIVGTYDGANQKIYINGVLDATEAETAAIAATSYPLYIGVNSGDIGEDFEGSLANVLIYNKGLTAAEVLQNYEATKPRFAPRIAKSGLELNLDAGDPASYVGGTTWTDTANGYNATLVNTTYSSEVGGSMDLDETNDSVTISSNAAGDFSMKGWSVLTYEFWIKRIDTTGWQRLLYESTQNLGGFLVGPAFSGSDYYAYIDTDDGSSGSAISGWGSTTDWIHLVTTYDGSNVVTYRNGVQVGTQSLTGDIKNTSGSYGGVVFGRTNHGGSDWFDGRVATIRVYQAALSAAEILDNYQATKGRFT